MTSQSIRYLATAFFTVAIVAGVAVPVYLRATDESGQSDTRAEVTQRQESDAPTKLPNLPNSTGLAANGSHPLASGVSDDQLQTGMQSFVVDRQSWVGLDFAQLPPTATVRLFDQTRVLASWGGDYRRPHVVLEQGSYQIQVEMRGAEWNGGTSVEVVMLPIARSQQRGQEVSDLQDDPNEQGIEFPGSQGVVGGGEALGLTNSPDVVAGGGSRRFVSVYRSPGAAPPSPIPAALPVQERSPRTSAPVVQTAETQMTPPVTESGADTAAAPVVDSPRPSEPERTPVPTPLSNPTPTPPVSTPEPASTPTPVPAPSSSPASPPSPTAAPDSPGEPPFVAEPTRTPAPIDTLLDAPSRGIFAMVFNNTVLISGVDAIRFEGGSNVRVAHGVALHDNVVVPPSRSDGIDALFSIYGGNTQSLVPANRRQSENGYVVLQMDPGTTDLQLWSYAEDPSVPLRSVSSWSPVVANTNDAFGLFD